ncbi:MAG TPA: DUF433 domain-containing protein [Plasticicumulans sp.]|nr:DUF433 domain-containing protein [Plasticicumulans sp.]HND98865.1 DUF433 domain-containing protein [Plasticicumulans sp.]HNF67640.1 DUF433 domain-containing protein [Plasticicumulans sp.]
MNWREHIVTDPEILCGKPCIKGTRLSVEFLLGVMAEGWSRTMLLENYPRLTDDDLRAVFAFAGEMLREEVIVIPQDAA